MRLLHIIIVYWVSAGAFATDRIVSPSGTYNTISSAIDASGDGDRVLVASGTYNEFISLSRSITMLPLTEGGKYNVTQNVFIENANGKTITIQGIRTNDIELTGVYNTRTEVRILDSRFDEAILIHPYLYVEMMRDTIGYYARICAGRVIGCRILGHSVSPDLPVAQIRVDVGSLLSSDIVIIGNHLGSPGSSGNIRCSANSRLVIENNFVVSTPLTQGIGIDRTADLHGPPSRIVNNTIYSIGSNSDSAISVYGTGTDQSCILKNNVSIGFNGQVISVPVGSNYVFSISHNMFGQASHIDPTTGAALAGSPLIDAGDPAAQYLDLDLSTNDVGCFGGSNSRANFTTGMGSAVVGFMQAPRVVSQGEPVNINAIGFDR